MTGRSQASARNPVRRRRARKVRFPCGHLEAEASASRRLRQRRDAVWIRCPCCNVIALFKDPALYEQE